MAVKLSKNRWRYYATKVYHQNGFFMGVYIWELFAWSGYNINVE